MINPLHRQARFDARHALRVLLAVGGLLTGALGCGEDTTGPATIPPAQTLWALHLNYHAINMALTAPYNTVQLTATAVNVLGDSLPDVGTVIYTAGDSTISVSSTGLITANFRTININRVTNVVATLTDRVHHVTLADTVFIQVTPTAPAAALNTFSIQPVAGDSAKRSLNSSSYTVKIVAKNTAAATVNFVTGTNPLIAYFASSDPNVASIDRKRGVVALSSTRPGFVTFYATTLAYGVEKRDSLLFTIGYSTDALTHVNPVLSADSVATTFGFGPATLTIVKNGQVRWQADFTGDPIDVVFDDATSVQAGHCFLNDCVTFPPSDGGGNIATWMLDTATYNAGLAANDVTLLLAAGNSQERRRTFPVVGTYHYHSSLYPQATGKIVVLDDPAR